MGTRADFYIGKGKDAEWIGSVAWDGYEWGERICNEDPDDIVSAKNEQEYRDAVNDMIKNRKDGTRPDMGWPWPWDDSGTTDCTYCFVDGGFEAFSWGEHWNKDDEEQVEWPYMAEINHSAPAGSDRSGVILITT